jgi:uncharacterized protein (DUF3084 family)
VDNALIALLVGLLAAPVASLATFLLNRRKTGVDIISSITDAGHVAVETVTTALEIVNLQLEEVRRENQVLHKDMCDLKEQNKKLMAENEELRKDLLSLKNQNNTLMIQIRKMQEDFSK